MTLHDAIKAEVASRWPGLVPVRKVSSPEKELAYWQISEALNTPGLPGLTKAGPMGSRDALALLIAAEAWGPICVTAQDGEPELRGRCISVRDACTLLSTLPPGFDAYLTALVAANLISEETRSAVLALGEVPISWVESVCGTIEDLPNSLQWLDVCDAYGEARDLKAEV